VEYNTDPFKAPNAILAAVREKRDLFGRAGRYTWVPLDERFPTWLRENAASRYDHLMGPRDEADASDRMAGTPLE
jgi:CRISPR/Cas system endoribonuclease Cas6 (RAMP superfamily)